MKKLKLALAAFIEQLKSKEIDSRPFRKVMNLHYYSGKGFSVGTKQPSLHKSITDVRVYEAKDNYRVVIYSHSPGLLIGHAGSEINKLVKFLNIKDGLTMEFKKPVKVDVKECEVWKGLN